MNSTLNDLITKGWNVGEKNPVKGYNLKVLVEKQEKLVLKAGNQTANYKAGFQDFSRRGKDYEVSLNIYS